jgi:DNA-binding response OmpR family regulator
MRNPQRALSREEILQRVWNHDFGGRSSVVDLYVSYLRRKIDAGREPMIHTVRGVGYLLRPMARTPSPKRAAGAFGRCAGSLSLACLPS